MTKFNKLTNFSKSRFSSNLRVQPNPKNHDGYKESKTQRNPILIEAAPLKIILLIAFKREIVT